MGTGLWRAELSLCRKRARFLLGSSARGKRPPGHFGKLFLWERLEQECAGGLGAQAHFLGKMGFAIGAEGDFHLRMLVFCTGIRIGDPGSCVGRETQNASKATI